MSRKPQTPNDDEKPAGTDQQSANIPVGKRFSNNKTVLEIEKRLAADGVELPNRAIPMEYHETSRDYDNNEIQEIIELELKKDNPNRQLIGYLNGVKQ